MAKFKLGSVKSLEYDFRGLPGMAGAEAPNGSGIIPDPDPESLDEVFQALKDVEESIDDDSSIMAQREMIYDVLGKLDIPREHLEPLPQRFLTAFFQWVCANLTSHGG